MSGTERAGGFISAVYFSYNCKLTPWNESKVSKKHFKSKQFLCYFLTNLSKNSLSFFSLESFLRDKQKNKSVIYRWLFLKFG